MCGLCVINAVSERMLQEKVPPVTSKPPAFASSSLAPSSLKKGHSIIQDLTHTLTPDFPTYDGCQQLFMEPVANFETSGYNLLELRYEEHIGTHIDAPLHFSPDGSSVDKLEVGNLIAPLCIIDIREKADSNADCSVTIEDIKKWERTHGDIPNSACVAMLSGWSDKLGTDRYRNIDDSGTQHYPGFHPDAAQYLMEAGSVASIGVDTLSLDCGNSTEFEVHQLWLPSGRFGIEALANLDKMPANGSTIVIGAPKHKNGSGGPARIFGLI